MHSACICLAILLLPVSSALAQVWQQTASTPEGSGVTKLVVRESNRNIFVTTGAFSWPSGDMGGVRRSDDNGASWDNLVDCYIGRTIIDAPDGNLYASIWHYPSNEGLYRSTDNGDSWGTPLTTVPSGNNIFSITLNMTTTPPTILIGTRTGVRRSINDGADWDYVNNGIPTGSWVRDLAVDDSGVIAAATTNGLFISVNNGDSWLESIGITPGQYPVILNFVNSGARDRRLNLLTQDAELHELFPDDTYYIGHPVQDFCGEGSGLCDLCGVPEEEELDAACTYSADAANEGFILSWDGWETCEVNNEGLPGPAIRASSLSGVEDGGAIDLFLGCFENTNGGAKVFTIQYECSGVVDAESELASGCMLRQNRPNPFRPSTTIEFAIPVSQHTTLELVDASGRLVSTLVDDVLSAGSHRVTLSSERVNSGVYHYCLRSGSTVITRKLALVR